MHWHRGLTKWALPLPYEVLWGHQLGSMLYVKPVVCRGTHPLSATMVHPPVSTPTPCAISIPHHRATHTPTHKVRVGGAIPTIPTRTTAPILKSLCQHLDTNIELSTSTTFTIQIKLGGLMEQFIATQTKTNETLRASINQVSHIA